MKPPASGTFNCRQCKQEYLGDQTKMDKEGNRVCPAGHPVELIFTDYTNTVRFPGEHESDPEQQHLNSRDKVPEDVTLWEEVASQDRGRGHGLPLAEGEEWKLF